MNARGDWVQIETVLLAPEHRPEGLPAETRACPYVMRVNGYLEDPADAGQECRVRTLSGRRVAGRLLAGEPAYGHSYGRVIRELLDAHAEAQARLRKEFADG